MQTVLTQDFLFPELGVKRSPLKQARAGSFIDNMSLPVHRWFRYSAGFSAEWVKQMVQEKRKSLEFSVLDPFAGSGTTLVAAGAGGASAIGLETHPFMSRIAKTKIQIDIESDELLHAGKQLLDKAGVLYKNIAADDCPDLLARCFSADNLLQLEALRLAYTLTATGDDKISALLWLAITSILRECSHVGTAQWQYILPNKSKKRVLNPFTAFLSKIRLFSNDIALCSKSINPHKLQLREEDARNITSIAEQSIDLVITSPPYPNNYDYADSTRLEMTFWREITSWGDLHDAVRRNLICSCSQHSAKEKYDLDALLLNLYLEPIHHEIEAVCRNLASIRQSKGGKKTYHTMVAAYFIDLARVLHSLRKVCKKGSELCFVIGDSAPYGIYVPVDKWLGELAMEAGFVSHTFEKNRDRNTKWKNRKHTVPLKEGNLWIKG